MKLHFKRKYEKSVEFISIVFHELKSNFERCFFFFIIAKFVRRMNDCIYDSCTVIQDFERKPI